MKPEEALMRVGKAQERTERMARGRGGRAQLASYANEAEALRIVLAMAKAAREFDLTLRAIREWHAGIQETMPDDLWNRAIEACVAFRKASGGDAP